MHLEGSTTLHERGTRRGFDPVHEIHLPVPPHWRASLKLWRQILAQSRQYLDCRPSMFATETPDETLVRQFDELATIAHAIRRGASMTTIANWLKTPHVRRLRAAQNLRGLLNLMDTVGVF